jgi:hypothetical protein
VSGFPLVNVVVFVVRNSARVINKFLLLKFSKFSGRLKKESSTDSAQIIFTVDNSFTKPDPHALLRLVYE